MLNGTTVRIDGALRMAPRSPIVCASMELVLLGSAGWIPTGSRETCCALVRQGSEALVIDAGTGLRRLLTDPALLDGVRNVTIVLSRTSTSTTPRA